MQIEATHIPDVKRVTLRKHEDARGFFIERFRADLWAQAGYPFMVQCNHSRSAPGVLRGLHLQHSPAQGKLVGVTSGCVFDVAVDMRPDSPSYLQHVALELDATTLLWIPEGFLHGFCVLGEQDANMLYFTTTTYHPEGEAGVHYADPDIGIDWPIATPTVSARDAALPLLKDAKYLYKS
jgi:dTDP-4-dehydrorhamnose 3,5-epimerase